MALLLLLLALVVDFGARRAILESVDADLRNRAEEFARDVVRRERFGPPPGFNRHLPRPPRRPDESQFRPRFVRLVPKDDRPPETPYDPPAVARAAASGPLFTEVTRDGGTVRVYSLPVQENGQTEGVIQVSYATGGVLRSLEGLRALLLTVVIPLGVALAGLLSLYLVDRLLSPLRRITRDAEAFDAGRLGQRLPVVGGDEFARLAATLNGMLDRLEAIVAQGRRFTADASHELKTPLAVVKAHASLLRDHAKLGEEDRESAAAISAAADRMNRLVGDLLTLARADAPRSEDRSSPCDLAEIARKAILAVPGATDRVRVEGAGPLPVRAVREDIERVLVNLVQNALIHAETAEPVTVVLRRERGEATVEVRDRGIGVAPEHLPHLFDRFYRTDRSRAAATGGTGLGLAIAKGIVEAHGGRITVASEPGEGTTFTVRLPAL